LRFDDDAPRPVSAGWLLNSLAIDLKNPPFFLADLIDEASEL
jgi:hypothetical protein